MTVLNTAKLGFPWPTLDPFLFCVHHLDLYPEGTSAMGPDPALLQGRNMGSDFTLKDGWRMYHGNTVPGFPRHPHRGFETVTIARQGFIDHSDSLGATARFGPGDVQWMTAGKGIVHAEMFPMVHQDRANPGELFQIWLNLPARDKMVDPYFTMFWADKVPKQVTRGVEMIHVAGQLGGSPPPAPPPNSWAADPTSDLAIVTLKMQPGARTTLPPAQASTNRMLYFFKGDHLSVGDRTFEPGVGLHLDPIQAAPLSNGPKEAELLLLQGRPIGEPVAHHGPFVMNSRVELQQAFADYQNTQFGGWPWKADGPVHAREQGRFALHQDGREERPVG